MKSTKRMNQALPYTALKHPKELGLTLGMKIIFDDPARIIWEDSVAASRPDIVYVALIGDGDNLQKGDALKVGQSGKSLRSRWGGIVGIFGPERKLRANELSDRKKLQEAARNKEISVWVKKAGKIAISYAEGLTVKNAFSIRCAEEDFLDQYYEPQFGKPLNRLTE